jgi:hypothetical protein
MRLRIKIFHNAVGLSQPEMRFLSGDESFAVTKVTGVEYWAKAGLVST